MPYLGNTPSTSFATVVKDSFNGGSTAYTLSKVATTNSVSVFVENVRQEPTTAYTVSGTTLTFTATTPSGTGNIYVLHMNPTTTTTHPASQALTATTGTFTSTVDVNGNELILDADADTSITADTDDTIDIKIGGSDIFQMTASKLDLNGKELILDADGDTSITSDTDDEIDFKTAGTDRFLIDSSGFLRQRFTSDNSTTAEGFFINNMQNSTGNNASLIFSNDSGGRKKAAIAHIDTGTYGAGDLVFAIDGADSGALHLTNDEKMRIDSSGNVTMPSQPAFHATSTGSGFGHDSIMVFNTAHVNTGSHYNTSNGKFTAPVAGVYFFYHKNIGTSSSTVIRVKVYYNDSIFTAYKTPSTRQDTSTGNDYAEGVINFVVSLSANDTIKLGTFADDSSSGIYNDNSGGQGFNYFGGYLIG